MDIDGRATTSGDPNRGDSDFASQIVRALEELAKTHVHASKKPETEAFDYLARVRTRVTSSLRTALPSSRAAPPRQTGDPLYDRPPPPTRDETNEMIRQLEARMEAKLETEGEALKARIDEKTSALKMNSGKEIAALRSKAEEVVALREEMRVTKAQEATKHAALQNLVNGLSDLATQGKVAAVEAKEGVQALKDTVRNDLYGPAIGNRIKKSVTSELDRTTGPYNDGIVKRVEGLVKEQLDVALAGPLLPAVQSKANEIADGAFQAKMHDLEQRILDRVDASVAQYSIGGYHEGLLESGIAPAVAARWLPPSMRNPPMQPHPKPHMSSAPPLANPPDRPRRVEPPPPPPPPPAPAPAPANGSSEPDQQRSATLPLSTSTSRLPASSRLSSTIQSPLENPNVPVTQKQLADHKQKTIEHLKKLQDKMWDHFERLKGEFNQVKKRVGEDGPASVAQSPVATRDRSPNQTRTSSGTSEEERPSKRARMEAPADPAVEQNRLANRLMLDEAMKKIEELEAALKQGFEKVSKGQDDLTRRVSGIERDNTGLSEDITSVKDRQRIDRASAKAESKVLQDSLKEKVDRTTFDAKINEVERATSRATSFQSQQLGVKQVIGIVHDHVPAIVRDPFAHAGVDAVASQLEDILNRVNNVDAAEGQIKKVHAEGMEITHGKISDIKEETRILNSRLDTLNSTASAIADIGAKLAELSQSVATLQAFPRPPDLSARKDLNTLSDGSSARDLASKIAETSGFVESQQANIDALGKPTPPFLQPHANLKTTSLLATTTVENFSETKQRLERTVSAVNSLGPYINTIYHRLGSIQREATMAVGPGSGAAPQPPTYSSNNGGGQAGPSSRPGQSHSPQYRRLSPALHQPLHQQTRLAQSQGQRPPSPFSKFVLPGAAQDRSK
ncbi:hypothetical protein JCM21900_004126 [Sporobolomyces salmonicolor]